MRKIFVLFILLGCGGGGGGGGPEAPPPPVPVDPPIVVPPDLETSYEEFTLLFEKYCIKCHASDPFIESEELMRASDAKVLISTKAMPLDPEDLGIDDRIKMLAFF